MSGRVSSSPNLLPLSINNVYDDDGVSLEGIATNVKLLLKLIQDHQEASQKGALDDRRSQRFAGMMTILDDVKTRLHKSQFSSKRSLAELRRCNTDLRATVSNPPSPRDPPQTRNEILVLDDKEKLRKELNTSYAAQKRLGVMCASLGKEKDIIARELTRKVQELNEMEELVNDLKTQNEKLSAKVQACVAEHKEVKKSGHTSLEAHQVALQQRNKELSEQLVKSLEGYKFMKRKLKEALDSKQGMQVALQGIGEEVEVGIQQIHSLKERIASCSLGDQAEEIENKILTLEDAFKKIESKVSRYRQQGRQ